MRLRGLVAHAYTFPKFMAAGASNIVSLTILNLISFKPSPKAILVLG